MNKLNNIAKGISTVGLSLILVAMVMLNGYSLSDMNISDSVAITSDKEIKDSFIDFKKYNCVYKDCTHTKEKECNVKIHINNGILASRYENYIKFIEKR